ncbi:MAG TPA: histidine kinase [Xanthomonadales bacterium]|nr:histidine kinase [Xanthomonadales bacterium]
MRDALKPYYWRFQLVGWALFCVLSQAFSYFLFEEAIVYFVLEFLILWTCGVLASHSIFLWADLRDWLSFGPAKLWPRVLGVCFVMGLLCSVPLLMFYLNTGAFMPEELRQVMAVLGNPDILVMLASGSLVFGVKLTLWFLVVWVIYQQQLSARMISRQRTLEFELQNAQLDQLRQQLKPHFLFNCMNSIRAMIHIDRDASSRMVDELTHILRYTLKTSEERVPLSEELKAVDSYLSLEQARLGDRLKLEKRIQTSALDFPLPPFLVQTLVENAIKHGISQRIAGGSLQLDAAVDADGLTVTISNDGELNSHAAGLGIGLNNSRRRLQLLYGRDDLLAIQQRGGAVVATLSIPAEPHPDSGNG